MGCFRRIRVLETRTWQTLGQKQRVALRSGFLGIDSLGWSTLAIVTEATEADRQAMVERLAGHLRRNSARLISSRACCRRRRGRVCGLADAITRRKPCLPCSAASRTAKSASASARSSRAKPQSDADRLHAHARAFTFHEVEGDIEPAEEVDLPGMIRNDRSTDRT